MRNQYGFTLIEIILVMVILSVLTSIFILRFERLSSSAAQQALKSGIIELNVRESLICLHYEGTGTAEGEYGTEAGLAL